MRSLHLALLLALFGPAAMAQTPINEGPKARPVPNTPHDAEHAPTRGDPALAPQTTEPSTRQKDATGFESGRQVKDRPPHNKDDAEHAPTRKTDEPAAPRTESGERRPAER